MNTNWKKEYPAVAEISEENLDENHSLKKILDLVGKDKNVIDFGCATGYLAQLLNKKGCTVTGVEINPNAAQIAEQYCERVIVADLDLVDLTEILPSKSFDVAIFGDVLEHLRNPWKVLEATQHLLKSQGYVVASVPNIAHGSIRLALLQGKFEYTELGILDNTHLRFFTRKTVAELFKHSGYFVDVIECTKLPIFAESPLAPRVNRADFNPEVVQQLEQEEDAETFQFILRAYPENDRSRYLALKEQYAQVVVELDTTRSQLQSTSTELDTTRSQLQSTSTELDTTRSQLQHTHTELDKLYAQIQQHQTEFEKYQSQLEDKHAQVQNLRSQFEQTQVELNQLYTQGEQTMAELKNAQLELQAMQAEVVRSHTTIASMKSSKFWKLRTAWFRFKQAIGITNNIPLP